MQILNVGLQYKGRGGNVIHVGKFLSVYVLHDYMKKKFIVHEIFSEFNKDRWPQNNIEASKLSCRAFE
jgi:hypothetical protein